EQTAEALKMKIGNAFPESTIEKMEIKGTDAITGLPRRLEVDSVEIREAIKDPVNIVVEWIKRTFSDTPPELGADIIDRGIVLTGGGAILKGLSRLIAKETGVPVLLANEPLLCVAIGAGRYHEIKQKKGY
ncbi:MAG: rod shape-determining protein, partial [Spirochaetota bacterium]